jgi:hypothetical protein
MNTFSKRLPLILMLGYLLSGSATEAQPTGNIIGWGTGNDGVSPGNGVPKPNGWYCAVAAGGSHYMGLRVNGEVAVWGRNESGQWDVPAPNADFIAIDASGYCVGLKSDGSVVAWGNGTMYDLENVPSPNANFTAIAAGQFFILGLKSDGTIVGWGRNRDGELNVPAPNADFTDVGAGGWHGLGLKSDGSIVAWGNNASGQLNVPAPNTDFIAVAAGRTHNLGLKSDGSIVAWGDGNYGRTTVPAPNADFIAIAAGDYHSLGLKSNGTVVGWGMNYNGQCDAPPPNSGFFAIAAGMYSSLGITIEAPVPTAMRSFDASWKGGRVVVAWRLIDHDGALGFEVNRRRGHEPYTPLNGVTIRNDTRGAFHFEDLSTEPGRTYTYHVTVLENGEAVTLFETSLTTPLLQLALGQNQPNPFNPLTRIPFVIDQSRHITIAVYDVAGTRVRTLVDEVKPVGSHWVQWDGRDGSGKQVASGVYVVRLEAGRTLSRKVVLMK